MKRKEISDKSRLLRGFLMLVAMIVTGTVVDCAAHTTFRFWLTVTFAPLALAGCAVFPLFYAAMRYKQKMLRLPESL
ncbi:MAG: hypothetical protein ABI197_08820 [Granulicella sp.]